MGFVYKNIPAFDLKTGDTIAFDLSAQNDVNIQLQINMAATTSNGGRRTRPLYDSGHQHPGARQPDGQRHHRDYELAFKAQVPFHFAGGGLIIRFSESG